MEPTQVLQGSQTTILVVDDEPSILNYVAGFLASSNYNVLTASSGAEALQISKDYKGEIRLLLSDFQMPGMTGIDLATKISIERPTLGVLLMSGFATGMLVLNEGWHFLPKPFIPSQLRAIVLNVIAQVEATEIKASVAVSEQMHR